MKAKASKARASQQAERVTAAIRAGLERAPAVNLHRFPVSLWFDQGDLVLDGDVESVAAKKQILAIAATTRGIGDLIDRLRVVPSRRMSDRELLDHAMRTLSDETSLQPCTLRVKRDGAVETLRPGAPEEKGQLDVSVVEGVITLDGDVPSLAQKRLAESLVWWIPGTRDVVNGLGVAPPEEDSDDDITDALKRVLQKDPLLKGLTIGVSTDHRVVTLRGAVPSETQRRAAEDDAWCLFGVDRVISTLQVHALR